MSAVPDDRIERVTITLNTNPVQREPSENSTVIEGVLRAPMIAKPIITAIPRKHRLKKHERDNALVSKLGAAVAEGIGAATAASHPFTEAHRNEAQDMKHKHFEIMMEMQRQENQNSRDFRLAMLSILSQNRQLPLHPNDNVLKPDSSTEDI